MTLRTLAMLASLVALATFAPGALAQSDDPFADEDAAAADSGASDDPFASYEARRNESFSAQAAEASAAPAASDDASASSEPAGDASKAAAGADAGGKDTPGLGIVAALGAIGIALAASRRR